MLTTFVIGLREGLEAALIVGIVAAFLRRRDRPDAIRQIWLGVLVATVICVGIAIALVLVSSELTRQAQEGMETVIGLVAVGMVTYMILWMRKHARGLRTDLEGAASAALATGSALALVGMAFLAVLREGIETAVFLLALSRSSGAPAFAAAGAALGILAAAALGYGTYRGGVRINLARFFRTTGLVLVLVAAGLLATAAHTAHEAGWLNIGQAPVLDLSWLVAPGSIRESLLTGVLGLRPKPTVVEVVLWLCYFVPLALYVAWPAPRRPSPPPTARVPAATEGSRP